MLLDAPVLPTSETLCSKDVLLPKTAVLEPRPTLKRDSKLLFLASNYFDMIGFFLASVLLRMAALG
jgi:hypothetical protein